MGQTKPFHIHWAVKKGKTKMTRKQDNAKERIYKDDLRQLLAEDRDLLKVIVEQTVQQILEAQREQAGKSERTETRRDSRAGYYSRTLVTRVGKIELRVPQRTLNTCRNLAFLNAGVRHDFQSAEKPYDCFIINSLIWWTAWGSNPRPPRCERGALPAELAAHYLL
jgi:hypothetical protein